MTGYVHTINRKRRLAALATEGHGFTIIELVGSEPIRIGDQFQWPSGRALGRTVFHNLSTGTTVNVNVLAHGVPQALVRQLLGL
jgi:hypothetical protein